MFSKQGRDETLRHVETVEYDLLIVGGGITGAGVARDAASRGLKVLVVEARDFASGTSSRSSKLVHGGIRYLENFEFGLVHEALTERRTLLQIAPHLVHPLRFVIPVYKNSRVGLFKLVDGGSGAIRVQVQLGRSSVQNVEIVEGLQEGDQVILSDMSAWDANNRVRLN